MPLRLLSILMATFLPCLALAAEWVPMLRDNARVVELDRASVLQSDPGTKVAWARIVLNSEEIATAGYASIKALNRYDCSGRSFYTVKRVYLDVENNVTRDERVADQRPIPVEAGSVDERLWREVCKPPSAKDLKKVAEEAGRAAAAAATAAPAAAKKEAAVDPKSLLQADFRPDAKPEPAKVVRTSESAVPPEPGAHSAAPAPSNSPVAPTPTRELAKPVISLPPPPPPKPEAKLPPPVPAPAASAPPASAPPPRPRLAAPMKAEEPERLAMLARNKESSRAQAAHKEMHWSYEGENGPDNWGRMNPEWAKCANGQRQSPVDIRDGIRVDQTPLRFDYHPSATRIVNNGHTIQVIPGDGNTLFAQGRRFELVQMHFHRPSEERVDGRAFDMVAHLVHRDQDGRLGVLAVLMEVGPSPNPVLQSIWNNLPLEKNNEFGAAEAIDLTQLLPANGSYYAYMGSLTTPPCTEDVLWLVLRQPLEISEDQLKVFARLYPRNIRPIQRLNDRLIKESR